MVMTVIDERSVDAYAAHGDELIRFATGLVGPSDAQDVAADAMARLMSSRVWMEVENPRALMYRAVLYEARTFVRSRRRRSVARLVLRFGRRMKCRILLRRFPLRLLD